MPTIDIVLPTYNRSDLLRVALGALSKVRIPTGHDVVLYIADNNSRDDTKAVAEAYAADNKAIRTVYLFEGRQGRQFALNSGIAAGRGEIVAMFDDDEKLDESWLAVIAREFADPAVDFIGGPYRPDWQAKAPSWLPRNAFLGAIGIIDNGPDRRRYGDPGFDAMPTGGNIAIRRRMLDLCGPYVAEITYAEDRYMYERLLANGARGYYVPDLVINHLIPASRLQKSYFRRWAYTEGVNLAKLERLRGGRGEGVLGLARWRWGLLLRAAIQTALAPLTGKRDDPDCFRLELGAVQSIAYLAERNRLVAYRYNDRSKVG